MQCVRTTFMDEVQVNYISRVASVYPYVQMSCQYSDKGSLLIWRFVFLSQCFYFSQQNGWKLNSCSFVGGFWHIHSGYEKHTLQSNLIDSIIKAGIICPCLVLWTLQWPSSLQGFLKVPHRDSPLPSRLPKSQYASYRLPHVEASF